MLDPRTVMVAIPCYDGKIMAELAGALIHSASRFGAITLPTECSHISLARNLIAAQFMASPFEWLVCIDSDTVPSARDFELLLDPCDVEAEYFQPDTGAEVHRTENWGKDLAPRPSRVITAQCTPGEPVDQKTAKAADMLVCAEYSFKNDTLEPVKQGMGFVRIHRMVFEKLQELKHDGGPMVEVRRDVFDGIKSYLVGEKTHKFTTEEGTFEWKEKILELIETAEDKAGLGRLWQMSWKGRLYYDYFPSGPLISQFVPTAEWKGEDHGFFTLCLLAGIIPRIETRTRLMHIGRKGYPYLGPDSGGGQ